MSLTKLALARLHITLLVAISVYSGVYATSYQRCKTGTNCTVGEYLYDDNYSPINGSSCTITSKDPSGGVFINAQSMTSGADGWYFYTFSTSGATEGLYPTEVCCTPSGGKLCLDKSFEIGPSFNSTSDIAASVWGYGSRTLSGYGTLISDIWNFSTRGLTTSNLSSGQIATQSDISSQTTSIKGTDNKSLSDVSTDVAAVKATVDSIETKVNNLTTTIGNINTNVNTIISKWGVYSMSDVVTNITAVQTSLGTTSDTCIQLTVFGYIQCVRDKWGSQTADTLYTAANNAYTKANAIQTELGFNGKSTVAYDDIQSLLGYTTTINSSIGSAGDASSANTLFGRVKGVRETIDNLNVAGADLTDVLAKWGSYSATDLYNKINNISEDIKDLNTIPGTSEILTQITTNNADVQDLENTVLALQAIVEVNRDLLEKVGNQPITKVWLEEGSIVFKVLVTNLSRIIKQTVPLKYFLPKESKKENIMQMDSRLAVDYDSDLNAYYVHGDFELLPEQSLIFSIEVEDIWKLSDTELDSLRRQAVELTKPLQGTAFFAQGATLKSDIYANLDRALSLQKNAITPDSRIKAYREGTIEVDSAKSKLADLKTLVNSANQSGSLVGFVGGVQTVGVWGMVVVFITGFALLAFYMRVLLLKDAKQPPKHIVESVPKRFNNFPKIVIGAVILIIVFLLGGGLAIVFNKPKEIEIAKAVNIPVVKESTVSLLPTPTPVETKKEAIQPPNSLIVLENELHYVNVREGPGINFDLVKRIDVGTTVTEIVRKDNEKGESWVNIADGWVLSKYLSVAPDNVLGTTTSDKNVYVIKIPSELGFVNIRQNPSSLSPILAKLVKTHQVIKLKSEGLWINVKIPEKDNLVGWVHSNYVEDLKIW